jgi:hypothetical protein
VECETSEPSTLYRVREKEPNLHVPLFRPFLGLFCGRRAGPATHTNYRPSNPLYSIVDKAQSRLIDIPCMRTREAGTNPLEG